MHEFIIQITLAPTAQTGRANAPFYCHNAPNFSLEIAQSAAQDLIEFTSTLGQNKLLHELSFVSWHGGRPRHQVILTNTTAAAFRIHLANRLPLYIETVSRGAQGESKSGLISIVSSIFIVHTSSRL
jgi:hypothetical protein